MNARQTVFTIVVPQRMTCLQRSLKVCIPGIQVSETQLKDMLTEGADRVDHVMQSTNVLRAIANCWGSNVILAGRFSNGETNCHNVLDAVCGERWIRGNVEETSRQTIVITYANNHFEGVHGDNITGEQWKALLGRAEAILWPVSREDEELERALMESLQTAVVPVSREDEELERALMESLQTAVVPVSREDEELERAIAESLQIATEVMSPDESLLKWVCEASAQGTL
jgi:hypothetical protein